MTLKNIMLLGIFIGFNYFVAAQNSFQSETGPFASFPGLSGCQSNSFENACSADEDYGAETFTDACGAGWVRSHGTPTLVAFAYTQSGINYSGYYGYMWSAKEAASSTVPIGEGMFYPVTFVANQTYTVTIRLHATGGAGTTRIFAANGLTKSALTGAGNLIPTYVTSKTSIGTYTTSSTFKDEVLTFTPTQSYSQLWIYPEASTTTQYDLSVLGFSVCTPCNVISTYNTGTVPTGIIERGTINVGSTAGSAGSGTVTSQSNQTTVLNAYISINILPLFEGLPGNGSFTASIIQCPGTQASSYFNGPMSATSVPILPISKNEISQNSNFSDSEFKNPFSVQLKSEKNASLIKSATVYPTIGSGDFTINGPIDANSQIQIFDQSGRKHLTRYVNTLTYSLNLSAVHLPNGTYIVKFVSNSKKIIQKIIIQK